MTGFNSFYRIQSYQRPARRFLFCKSTLYSATRLQWSSAISIYQGMFKLTFLNMQYTFILCCIGIHDYNTLMAFFNSRMIYFTWIIPCIMEYQDIGLHGLSTLMVTEGSGGSFLLNIRYAIRSFMLSHVIQKKNSTIYQCYTQNFKTLYNV